MKPNAKKPQEHRIIISGAGGQGVLFAGVLLAQGALEAGRHTTFFPSYGAEIRGGAAMAGVIISDEPIGSPVVEKPDALLILNNVAFAKYARKAAPAALIVVNSSIVKSGVSRTSAQIPASELALDLGDVKTANVIMLGHYLRMSDVLALDSLKKACALVAKSPALADLNKKALDTGYHYKP